MAQTFNNSRTRNIQSPIRVLSRAIDGWFRDRCLSNAASIAFFALFSLAPMLILVVTVASYGARSTDVASQIFSQLELVIGVAATQAIKQTVSSANLSDWSASATIASLAITLIGASATFTELKAALNSIFLGPPQQNAPFAHATWAFFRARILSGALVIGLGGILIIAVIAEGIASFFVQQMTPTFSVILQPIAEVLYFLHFDSLTSAALLAASFTVLLVVLPDIKIAWIQALIGALVATGLFMFGKYAFGFYLKAASTANAFGAAGSAVVTLMWIFYSAAVFLFGAEVLKALQTENPILLNTTKETKVTNEN
jgi:membrane protein